MNPFALSMPDALEILRTAAPMFPVASDPPLDLLFIAGVLQILTGVWILPGTPALAVARLLR